MPSSSLTLLKCTKEGKIGTLWAQSLYSAVKDRASYKSSEVRTATTAESFTQVTISFTQTSTKWRINFLGGTSFFSVASFLKEKTRIRIVKEICLTQRWPFSWYFSQALVIHLFFFPPRNLRNRKVFKTMFKQFIFWISICVWTVSLKTEKFQWTFSVR